MRDITKIHGVKLKAGLMLAAAVAGLAGAGVSLVGASRQASAAQATVSMAPGSMSATVGETVKVTFKATDVANLGAYEFIIEYDPDVLEFSGRTDSGWLGSTGRVFKCPEPILTDSITVDGEPAKWVQFGCASDAFTPAGPSGAGTLAEASFKAIGNGTSDLVFRKLELANPEGNDCCGLPSVAEAAVAVGASSDPPPPPTPAPNAARRVSKPASGATLPVYELLPDGTTDAPSASGSAGVGPAAPASGGSSSATPGGSSVRGSTSAPATQGSSNFPVAGQGYESSGSDAMVVLAYAFGAAGILFSFGALTVETVRRRNDGGPV